jgi:hypothetical protein
MARGCPSLPAQHHGGALGAARNERRYRAYTTSIPALALGCLFIKQATANVRSLPMVAAVADLEGGFSLDECLFLA